jgi:hypothetical protein
LPDSSPELKEVFKELQTVLREQTACIRALAAEGIMSRPEVPNEHSGDKTVDKTSDQHAQIQRQHLTEAPETIPSGINSERERQAGRPARSLFNSVLRLVLQNPVQKSFS